MEVKPCIELEGIDARLAGSRCTTVESALVLLKGALAVCLGLFCARRVFASAGPGDATNVSPKLPALFSATTVRFAVLLSRSSRLPQGLANANEFGLLAKEALQTAEALLAVWPLRLAGAAEKTGDVGDRPSDLLELVREKEGGSPATSCRRHSAGTDPGGAIGPPSWTEEAGTCSRWRESGCRRMLSAEGVLLRLPPLTCRRMLTLEGVRLPLTCRRLSLLGGVLPTTLALTRAHRLLPLPLPFWACPCWPLPDLARFAGWTLPEAAEVEGQWMRGCPTCRQMEH